MSQGILAGDLVGQQNTPNSGVGKALHLPEAGTGDPNGAGLDLAKGQGQHPVILEVGTETGGLVPEERRHPRQVGFQNVQIDHQDRRIKSVERTPLPLAPLFRIRR